jgi:hypothetical protein
MKWFPTSNPPESTPAVVERCRRASRVGYCFALVWAAGALTLLAFGTIELDGWAWVGPVTFLLFAEGASRSACLHERIIELAKRLDDLTPAINRNEH